MILSMRGFIRFHGILDAELSLQFWGHVVYRGGVSWLVALQACHTHTHFPCSNSLFILVIQQRVQPTHSHCSACMCIFSCTLDGPSPFRTLRWLFFNNRETMSRLPDKKKVTQWKHPIQLNKAGPWIWSDHKSPFAFECLYQDHQGSTSLFTMSGFSGLKSCSGTPVSVEAVNISV